MIFLDMDPTIYQFYDIDRSSYTMFIEDSSYGIAYMRGDVAEWQGECEQSDLVFCTHLENVFSFALPEIDNLEVGGMWGHDGGAYEITNISPAILPNGTETEIIRIESTFPNQMSRIFNYAVGCGIISIIETESESNIVYRMHSLECGLFDVY